MHEVYDTYDIIFVDINSFNMCQNKYKLFDNIYIVLPIYLYEFVSCSNMWLKSRRSN